jgi:hypothetical protein
MTAELEIWKTAMGVDVDVGNRVRLVSAREFFSRGRELGDGRISPLTKLV